MEMAELFNATKQNISLHLKNVFADGELSEDSVVKDSLTTAADGNCQGILDSSTEGIAMHDPDGRPRSRSRRE